MEGFEIEAHRIGICIIEDNKLISRLIEDYIKENDGFELVGVARDGKAGEELLNEKDFDAAIIDVILPYKDGISLLENFKTAQKSKSESKVFVMLTGINHDALTRSAYDNGADYLMLKPFDTAGLFSIISKLYNRKTGKQDKTKKLNSKKKLSVDVFVDDLLGRLDIHRNLKGYLCLRSAIIKTIENRSVLNGITKILYPAVAKEYDSTPIRVERVIRHAIDESWNPEIGKIYARRLSNDAYLGKKPSNREFILAAAEAYEKAVRDGNDS